MIPAVLRLLDRWQADDPTVCRILNIEPDRLLAWRVGKYDDCGEELTTRLMILLHIHTRLRVMFRDPQRGYGWVSRPNDQFRGHTPLEVLGQRGLQGLIRVMDYLDAEAAS